MHVQNGFTGIDNCRTVTDGVESDHLVVHLDLALTSLKHKSSAALDRGTTDWHKIFEDKATNIRYNDMLPAATNDNSILYEDFQEEIKKAGEDTALLVKSKGDNWFIFNRDYIASPINECNQLIHKLYSSATLPPAIANVMRDALAHLNKNVKDKVLIAKAQWAAHLCAKIHNMAMNPRLAWEHLTGGSTAHHKKSVPMTMKMPNGNITTNGEKTCLFLDPTLSVFSTTIVLLISPSSTKLLSVPCPPSLTYLSPLMVDAATNKLKNDKSPGLNGIPPEAYKTMNSRTGCRIHRYVAAFIGGNMDYPGWHQSNSSDMN